MTERSDWEKGNAYEFQVIERPEYRSYLVSNAHYTISLSNPDDAVVVMDLLNKVQIGNGDGISANKFLEDLNDLQFDFLDHKGITLGERTLVNVIFQSIRELIK